MNCSSENSCCRNNYHSYKANIPDAFEMKIYIFPSKKYFLFRIYSIPNEKQSEKIENCIFWNIFINPFYLFIYLFVVSVTNSQWYMLSACESEDRHSHRNSYSHSHTQRNSIRAADTICNSMSWVNERERSNFQCIQVIRLNR